MSDRELLWHMFLIVAAGGGFATLLAYAWMLWHANDPPPDHDEP